MMFISHRLLLVAVFVLHLSTPHAKGTGLSVGSKCSSKPEYRCSHGLICEDGKCKIGDSRDCTNHRSLCISGKHCVGPSENRKQCKTLKSAGMKCEVDPYWLCKKDLECENKECKIPEGGLCTESPSDCKAGLSCVGTKHKKKCKVLKKVGQTCGRDPFWVCEEGLICQNNKCKIQRGGECTYATRGCASGLWCVGSGKVKRCEVPVPSGSVCGIFGFDFCMKGLTCEEKVCKIPKDQICTNDRRQCAGGLRCVGTGRVKRCKILKGPGQKCETDPFWFCDDGLVCEDKRCKIKMNSVCTDSPKNCVSGTECVGTGKVKKCKTMRGIGQQCGTDPFWVCKKGLSCEKGRCRISKNGVCTKTPYKCVSGTSCVGTGKVKRCKVLKDVGQTCETDPFWICSPGLTCDNKRCRIPKNKVCTGKEKYCATGTKCVGMGAEKRCKTLMGVGGRCETDPFWICEPGLICDKSRCRIGLHKECTEHPSGCISGSHCVGTRKIQKCKIPMAAGKRCGADPYWVCKDGLVCDEGDDRCKLPVGSACRKKTAQFCVSGSTCSGHRNKKCVKDRKGDHGSKY